MRLTEEEAHNRLSGCPFPGTVWRHKRSGVLYTVVCGCLIESTLVPAVVYQRHGGEVWSKPTWCRPLAEWADRFEFVDCKELTRINDEKAKKTA